MQILIFGASITWGAYDAEGGGWADRLKRHYFRRHQEHADEYINVHNLGIAGQTTADLLRRFKRETDERAEGNRNNIFIFCIGANDSALLEKTGTFQVAPEEYADNLAQIIAMAKEYSDTIALLTVTPVQESSPNLNRKGKVRKNEYVDLYNRKIFELGRSHDIDIIDVHAVLTDVSEDIFDADGLHPNSLGHEIMFKEILTYLERS